MDQGQFVTAKDFKAWTAYNLKLFKNLVCLSGALNLALSQLKVVPADLYDNCLQELNAHPMVRHLQKMIDKIEESQSIEDILKDFEGPIQ